MGAAATGRRQEKRRKREEKEKEKRRKREGKEKGRRRKRELVMPFSLHYAHDHDCGEHDCSGGFSLYKHIDTANIRALNVLDEAGVEKLFRPWEERNDMSVRVDS